MAGIIQDRQPAFLWVWVGSIVSAVLVFSGHCSSVGSSDI